MLWLLGKTTLPNIYWMQIFFYFYSAYPKTLLNSCSLSSCIFERGFLAFHRGDPSESRESMSNLRLAERAATDQVLLPNLSKGRAYLIRLEVKLMEVPKQLISIIMHFLPSLQSPMQSWIAAYICCPHSSPLIMLRNRYTP